MLRQTLGTLALALLLAAPVSAHHGWSWAQEEQIDLTGTVTAVDMAPPHPALTVEAQGGIWRVELGNPRNTEKSGFNENSAKPGDKIIAIGNRSLDPSVNRMKAVQIVIEDKTYDIYPERIER